MMMICLNGEMREVLANGLLEKVIKRMTILWKEILEMLGGFGLLQIQIPREQNDIQQHGGGRQSEESGRLHRSESCS
jgi:hypothetical protein